MFVCFWYMDFSELQPYDTILSIGKTRAPMFDKNCGTN